MAKRSKPMARCTKCGTNSWAPAAIHQNCNNIVGGKKCKGTYRSMVAENDWEECSDCKAEGRIDNELCTSCGGDGWINIRKN